MNPPAEAEQERKAPTSAAVEQIGFEPQTRLRWFSVRLLIQTAREAVVSQIFGSFVDRRELQASTPLLPTELFIDLSKADKLTGRDDLWIDYVSDIGDGFNAAAAVASLVARAGALPLTGSDETIPPARLVVFGGDEAYPSGSKEDYKNRLDGPYRSMMPWNDEGRQVLALPGNHDWYDGLVNFIKVFCQRHQWIGGWEAAQRRSYFAVKLPHNWWLWAIDTQLEADFDDPQLEHFRKVAEALEPGDGVILCWAKPSWVAAGPDRPEVYDQIEFFQRELLLDKHANVRLSLSGDSHHYARYAQRGTGEQKITAGGGGAYLSGTHNLPRNLDLPPQDKRKPDASEYERFDREQVYPETGWRMRAAVLWRIYGNRSFCLVPAVAYLLLALVLDAGWTALTPTPGTSSLTPIIATTLLVAVFGAALFAFARDKRRRPWRRGAAALLHLTLHVALVAAVVRAVRPPIERMAPGGSVEQVPAGWLAVLLAEVGPVEYVAVGTLAAVVSLTIIMCALGVRDAYPRVSWGIPLGWYRRSVLVARVLLGLISVAAVGCWVLSIPYLDAGLTHGEFLGAVAFGVGTLAGPFLVGLYLLIVGGTRWNVNGNELFSAQAIQDHKSFLSLHVTKDGVQVYAVAVDSVPRRWRFVPDRPYGPWFAPADRESVTARLIERVAVTRIPPRARNTPG